MFLIVGKQWVGEALYQQHLEPPPPTCFISGKSVIKVHIRGCSRGGVAERQHHGSMGGVYDSMGGVWPSPRDRERESVSSHERMCACMLSGPGGGQWTSKIAPFQCSSDLLWARRVDKAASGAPSHGARVSFRPPRAPPHRLTVDPAAKAGPQARSCASNAQCVFTAHSHQFAPNVWPHRR